MSLGSRGLARALAAGALSAVAFGALAAAAPAALADNSAGGLRRPLAAVEAGVGGAEATALRPPLHVPPPGAGLDAHIPRLPEAAVTAG